MAKKSPSRFPGGARREGPGSSPSRAASREERTGRPSNPSDASAPNLLDYFTVRRLIVVFVAIQAVLLGILFFNPTVRSKNFGALAGRAVARGDWHLAVGYYESAVRRSPRGASANLELGRCLLEMNRPAEALERFDVAVANREQLEGKSHLEKRLAEVYALRGKALMQLKRPEEALESAQDALEWDPGQPLANLLLGRYLLDNDRIVEAADHVRYLSEVPKYADEFTSLTARIRERLSKVDPADLADVPERVETTTATTVTQK